MVLLHCLWFKYMINLNKLYVHDLSIKYSTQYQSKVPEETITQAIEEASHHLLVATAKMTPLILLVFALYTRTLGIIFS
jgi:hypothetical protein